jgi:hypothetical protein
MSLWQDLCQFSERCVRTCNIRPRPRSVVGIVRGRTLASGRSGRRLRPSVSRILRPERHNHRAAVLRTVAVAHRAGASARVSEVHTRGSLRHHRHGSHRRRCTERHRQRLCTACRTEAGSRQRTHRLHAKLCVTGEAAAQVTPSPGWAQSGSPGSHRSTRSIECEQPCADRDVL